MRKVPDNSQNETTRQALLQAAGEVFAEHGLQIARMRQIAERAGVNLSAINYHFGSKEGLYDAVLDYWARDVIGRYPLITEETRQLPAEERFRHLVRNLLRRFISPQTPSRMSQLMMRELANPTQALDRVVETVSKPQMLVVAGVIGELMGSRADMDLVRRCTFSVVGQCLFFLFGRPLLSRLAPEIYATDAAIDELAAHIARFSLAGIAATRPANPGEAP